MIEFICSIPENIGWIIVGVAGAFLGMSLIEVFKIAVIAIKERIEDEEDEEE